MKLYGLCTEVSKKIRTVMYQLNGMPLVKMAATITVSRAKELLVSQPALIVEANRIVLHIYYNILSHSEL
jgi:hypothetical protein